MQELLSFFFLIYFGIYRRYRVKQGMSLILKHELPRQYFKYFEEFSQPVCAKAKEYKQRVA